MDMYMEICDKLYKMIRLGSMSFQCRTCALVDNYDDPFEEDPFDSAPFEPERTTNNCTVLHHETPNFCEKMRGVHNTAIRWEEVV